LNVNEDIKISIIIPTFNSSQTLKECLDSIVGQDYKNFEVWLIDNVSTDTTPGIIANYELNYSNIHYISEKDKGIYDAMNKGIELARGEWIYFMGSDDTLINNDVLSSIANQAGISDAEVIYGNVIMRGKNQWNVENRIFDGEYNTEKLIARNICHQAIFYRKSVFDKNGRFNLKYVTAADFDFNLRCYANSKFSYVNLIIANFFTGGKSTLIRDTEFFKDKGSLLLKYFGVKIFTKPFITSRFYLKQAALLSTSPLNWYQRLFCLAAYTKLKIQSIYN